MSDYQLALRVWACAALRADEYGYSNLTLDDVLRVDELHVEEASGYCETCREDARVSFRIWLTPAFARTDRGRWNDDDCVWEANHEDAGEYHTAYEDVVIEQGRMFLQLLEAEDRHRDAD